MVYCLNVTAIVTVVVVGTNTDSSRQAVNQLIGKVNLSTIDILLTLHLRVEGVLIGRDAIAGKHAGEQHVEHGNTLLVFHETATAHDTDHSGESPAILLVGCEESWHDRSRSLAFIRILDGSAVYRAVDGNRCH